MRNKFIVVISILFASLFSLKTFSISQSSFQAYTEGILSNLFRSALITTPNQKDVDVKSFPAKKEEEFKRRRDNLIENIKMYEKIQERAKKDNDEILLHEAREGLKQNQEVLAGMETDDVFRFLITVPDTKTAKEISQIARRYRVDIYRQLFNKTAPLKQDPPLKIELTINPARNIILEGSGEGKFLFDQGNAYCFIDATTKEECLLALKHEMTHAILNIEFYKKFPNIYTERILPAAIDEGIADYIEGDKVRNLSQRRTVAWYKLTGTKLPSAEEILNIKKLEATAYSDRAHAFVLIDFLISKGMPKLIDFTTKYIETKSWDEAAKIYGYRDIKNLNNEFQKWVLKEYSKIDLTPKD